MEKHETGVNVSPLKSKEVMKIYFYLTILILNYEGGWWKYLKSSNDVWTNHQDEERETSFNQNQHFFFILKLDILTKLNRKTNMAYEVQWRNKS